MTPQTCRLIENLCTTLSDNVSRVDLQTGARRLRGDVRALHLVLKYKPTSSVNNRGLQTPSSLQNALERLKQRAVTELVQQGKEFIKTRKKLYGINANSYFLKYLNIFLFEH